MGERFEDESAARLFARAAPLDVDDHARWDMIHVLRLRGTREIFDQARALLAHPEPSHRTLGADVLAQLARGDDGVFAFRAESLAPLVRTLVDPHPRVVASAIYALGHLGADELPRLLAPLVSHADDGVRLAIAFALGGTRDARGIEILIALSSDRADDVRNWATFGLGDLAESDDGGLRDALAERLDDAHEETRREALLGLAKRRDPRAKIAVLRSLCGDSISLLALEAAEHLRDRDLLPALLSWRAQLGPRGDADLRARLDAAIEACERGFDAH